MAHRAHYGFSCPPEPTRGTTRGMEFGAMLPSNQSGWPTPSQKKLSIEKTFRMYVFVLHFWLETLGLGLFKVPRAFQLSQGCPVGDHLPCSASVLPDRAANKLFDVSNTRVSVAQKPSGPGDCHNVVGDLRPHPAQTDQVVD